MKKGLFSVITLLLSLTCSIACFACTGVSDFDDSASDSSVVEEHVHEFDGIVVTTNPTKLVYTAKETFDMTGIQVSKHCTLAGCEGEEITEGITFEYEKEGATYLTGDMSKVIIKALDYTADLAITVNKIEVELPEIADVEYTGSAITATVPESELYTVTENVGGTDVGEYEVKLALTDSVNYKFKDVEGGVAIIKYNITKVSNTVTLADVAAINCGETPAPSATALEDAEISYVYSATEDGEYTATIEGGFVEGTYYVKALAAETDSYKATYSEAKSFTVTHKLASWNTEGADEDVGLCVCGANLTETFSKKVTAARQDVVLTATTSAIALTGVSEYASVKSIKYGEISLGTNIASLDKSAEALADAVHGEQNLTIVVVDSYELEHTITVPVTIVTAAITTYDELVGYVTYKSERGNTSGEEDKYREGKYYILANDITNTGSYSQSGRQWAYKGRGFAGTLDGRTHSVIGGIMFGGGLFGSIESATIKNIKFKNIAADSVNRTLFAGTLYNAVLENVEIYITDNKTIGEDGAFFGVIASHNIENLTLTNVKIDASGSVLPWIIGRHSVNADPQQYHCTNVEIIAKSVGCFGAGNAGKLYFGAVQGVKFNFSGTVIDAPADEIIDPKEPGWFLKLTQEPWSKFGALKAVTLVCGETQVDITEYAERVLDETSNGIGFGNLGFLTEAMYNKSATLKIEFDVGEGSVAKFDYKVGIGDVNVPVTLTTRQDVVLKDSDGAKTAFTLNLGDYGAEDCTLTKVTYGSIELDVTEDGKVTISDELKNATHGEVNLLAVVSKGKTVYSITVPVTIVTETFSTVDTIIATIGYHVPESGKTHEGKYYTLAGNISYSGSYACYKQDTTDAIGAQGNGHGFAGTFDGRNYTISGGNFYGGGLFGALSNATVKNVKFTQVNPVGTNRTLIADSIWNSTLENIEIATYAVNISSANANFGVIARGHCIGLTLKDVTINMRTSVVPWIFGNGYGNANSGNITFDNVSITAGAIGCLTINSYEPYVKLYPDQVSSGLTYTLSGSTSTAPVGTEIDPTAEYFEFDLPAYWSHFATVKSVQFVYENNTPVDLEFSNITVTDGKMKIVGLSGCLDESMYNETVTLKIEFNVGKDNVAKFDYKVGVLDTNTKATLTTRQDVILRDSEGAKSTFTLDLGTTYSGATIKKVKYGTTKFDIGENNVISIPDALNNAAHGEQNLTVVITKDETGYTLTVPVTIVTETFSSVARIMEVVSYKNDESGKKLEGKYYTLAQDISNNGGSFNTDTSAKASGNGFAGTFDGRNHTISNGNFYGGGLFGALSGATIKNLNFTQINAVDTTSNRTLIAASVHGSTLENINITTYNLSGGYDGNSFGVIASGHCSGVRMKKVTINMGESEIPWIFGKGWGNASASNFTCENVVINLKSLKCLTINSNDGAMLANDAVTGITVIESSKTAG